jgi:hypothetical protein
MSKLAAKSRARWPEDTPWGEPGEVPGPPDENAKASPGTAPA